MAEASEAWAATGSWRGDLKLFARIAEKAVAEISDCHQPADIQIEFAVRDDLESYDSVEKLLQRIPPSTTRSFRSARIHVGKPGLRVDVCFGRKDPEDARLGCQYGVAIEATSDGTVGVAAVERVRSEVAKVVARGGFTRVRPPTEGPTEEHGNLETTLAKRWLEREIVTQLIFAGITSVVLTITTLISFLISDDGGTPSMLA